MVRPSVVLIGGEILKILAFDQASAKSGYAIFQKNRLIRWGVIDWSREQDSDLRFQKMCISLRKMIVSTSPDFVFFEGVSFQTNPHTLALLAQIQGAIMMACIECNIPFTILKPSSWRKILGFDQGAGITRKELKEQAKAYVFSRFHIRSAEDQCEAICIGHAATFIPKENNENEAEQ